MLFVVGVKQHGRCLSVYIYPPQSNHARYAEVGIALCVRRTVRYAESPLWGVLAGNLAQQGGHFDGCHGCFGSFVAHFAAGTFNCLLN